MEPIKSFGKLDWSKPLDPEKMRLDQATDYLIRVLDMLDETYGLKGKCVADIGGSNISPEIASFYGMKKMVCVDPVTRWYSDLGYDIQNTRYAQLDLVTNAHFQDAWENKSYFIMESFFRRHYLNPMIKTGQLKMTLPDKPKSGNQKYYV